MMNLAIHSAPRSGSTWLGNLFNSHPNVKFSYQPLFSYAFKNYLNPNSSNEEIESFFESIFNSNDDFINQKAGIEKGIIPEFRKNTTLSHNCYKEVRYHHILENILEKNSNFKLILLIRNPLAVLESWRQAPREFRKDLGWNFKQEWLSAPKKNEDKPESFYGYEKWKESTIMFHKLHSEYPQRVKLVRYLDLINDTVNTVEELFDFVDLDIDPQTSKFIEDSKSANHSDAYSVYKTKSEDDGWKQLPNSIIDYVTNDLENTQLERYIDE